ncbi:hypothetical protein [Prosthecobacter sp.]|uniref:hypothetical protein n=1 Tax=Prosthecobacter sp. TaxID=1965333 RepID=UPI003783F0DE
MRSLIPKTSRSAESIPQPAECAERKVTHAAWGGQESTLETSLPKKHSEAWMNEGCCGLKSAH